MATEAMKSKQARPSKYKIRAYHRCSRCGRPRAYYRKFGVCRICLRELAHAGRDPGHDQEQLVSSDMITDPIADMLTRIRNANQALHESVSMPSSGMRREIARILDEEGYIEGYAVAKGDVFDTLTVTLKYSASRERVISGVKRISKPGRRVYARKDRPAQGARRHGHRDPVHQRGPAHRPRGAGAQGVGGEVLCQVWYGAHVRIGKQPITIPCGVEVTIDGAAASR